MSNLFRKVAGMRAKRSGDKFEVQFESMCELQGISCVPIPDGCRQVGPKQLIRVRAPFDYCLCYNQRSAHVDTKITEMKTFSYSMIDQHQVQSLIKLSPGGPSGYVISIGTGQVYFVDVSILMGVGPGSGINFDNAVLLGNRLAFDVRRLF